MKQTRRKNILRGIKSSLNRFLSILFIVALGSGFMAGLAATSPDMYDTADKYMDDSEYYDINIKSPIGLTEDDTKALSELECVEIIQSAVVIDMVLTAPDTEEYTSRIYATLDSVSESPLNKVTLKQGRMPEKDGECVIQNTMGRYSDGKLNIGDSLSLSETTGNYEALKECVKTKSLKIVGFVESPICIGIVAEPTTEGTGRIQLDIYTKNDYFKIDYFTDAFITLKNAKELNTFSSEYKEKNLTAIHTIEAIAADRAATRTGAIKSDAQNSIDKSKEFIVKCGTVGKPNNDDIQELTNDLVGAATFAAINTVFSDLLTSAKNDITYALLSSDLTKKQEYLKSAADSLLLAEREIDNYEAGEWHIASREDSTGFSSYDSNVGKVAALAKIFPVFFFLVALLVALTTMTRLVEENRTQIGTLKALGFTNGQIRGEYILYSMLSSALGCVLGFAVGFRLFPSAISSAYGMMFMLPQTVTPFRIDIAAWVAPVTVGSILLATVIACKNEVRACPAEIIRPKAPAAGKRIFLEKFPFIWKRLSFTHKVTCRNLFRYKKRLFMTVIGVAGCSALLVTGFGLRDSINDIVDKQFGEIYKYNLTAVLNDATAPDNDAQLRQILDGNRISDWIPYSETNGKVIVGDISEQLKLCVPKDISRFSEFVTFRQRTTGASVNFSEDGAILTEKLCETLHIEIGDTVTVENSNGRQGKITVTGITENYITSFVYLSEKAYNKAFDCNTDFAMLLCKLSENTDINGLTEELISGDSVLYVSSSTILKDSFNDSIRSIDGVILVLIIAAGLLCIVVLYNLTNVNICERRKELATIRVLGFHKREVEKYIFRETNILSFIGSVVGLFAGILLHSFVVHTVEIDQVMFGRSIYPQSFLFALIISMVFTLAVNLIMRRQVRRIDMVEAMKAND